MGTDVYKNSPGKRMWKFTTKFFKVGFQIMSLTQEPIKTNYLPK